MSTASRPPLPRVRRLSSRFFALAAAAAFLLVPAAAPARPADFDGTPEDAVAEGVRLERDRKWGDAIRLYSSALEAFAPDGAEAAGPGPVRSMEYGLRRSKIHFGIHRRYEDPSFTDDLLRRSAESVLGLYSEVLSQVRRNYVEPIGATSLVAHGTESLYLALSDKKFLLHNLPDCETDGRRAKIARFRGVLRDDYWNRPVREGEEVATVRRVCALGERLCGLPPAAVAMEYLAGGTNALDDYSVFMTPHRLDAMYGNIEGNFVGIGIEIEAEGGKGQYLRKILPNSPAEAGGARAGEYISAISGVDCRDMTTDEAAKLLRGPEYSELELELTDAAGNSRRGRFVRRTVEVHSVERAEMIDRRAGVGYIRMGGFQETTAREMDAALASLRRQGMTKLIWDLRGNPGGLLDAAVDVLDRFVDRGTLVSTRGPAVGQTQTFRARPENTLRDLELVLLVDGDSASASEIVAGCLKDHGRGTIVGRTTYGKWSVQSIIDLDRAGRGTGIKLTTAKFYSPGGGNYTEVGLDPDVSVPEYGSDALFAAADPEGGPAGEGERSAAYRGGRVAAGPGGEPLPQTSLPLHEQVDIAAALRVFRR